MPTYRTKFEVTSFSVLPSDLNLMELVVQFSGKPGKIRVINKSDTNLLGKKYSKHLAIYCDIEAENIMEAIKNSHGWVNDLLDQFAFAGGAPIERARIEKAFDITPGVTAPDIWQFFYNPIKKVGTSTVDLKLLEQLIFGGLKNRNVEILRSTHWFRRSLAENDPLDRFTYLWTGLENLNIVAQRLYPDEKEKPRCPSCNHELKSFNGTAPLKRLFSEHSLDVRIYSRARELRQKLLHGFSNVGKITLEAIELIPDLSVALRTLICGLQGIDNELLNYEIDFRKTDDVIFLVTAQISGLAIGEKLETDEPNFTLNVKIEETEGKVVLKPTLIFPAFGPGMAILKLDCEIMGDTGYPFERASLEFTNQDIEANQLKTKDEK